MKGTTKPETALIDAAEKVMQSNEAFSKELERVLKA